MSLPFVLMRRTLLTLVTLVATVAVAGCGASASSPPTGAGVKHTSSASHGRHRLRKAAAAPHPAVLTYRRLYALPAPLRDPAYASRGGGRFVLIGGLSASDTSTSEVYAGNRSPGRASGDAGHRPARRPGGALLDGRVYVFGGGSFSELDHIFSFDPASHGWPPSDAYLSRNPTSPSPRSAAPRTSSAASTE